MRKPPAATVALLDRAERAWQRFFYPAADCFVSDLGDKHLSVDLEVADCLRLVLAELGRSVVTPDGDVPLESFTTDAGEDAGSDCFNCNKPIRVGQVVLPWNDAGECHANCDAPYALGYVRQEGDPEPVVLLGSPMRYCDLPDKRSTTFQQRVQPWLLACFGPMIAGDKEERNHRFMEESLELVQACGCTASEAHQLVDYVYGRPVGEPSQEVGGVMVTLAALCLANDLDMHADGETELARIWTKVEAIRAKQAAKPKHSPLPEGGEV
ncbi:hypothetical protein [Sphingobium sp. CECT 9361]|uniref:hypothetical protein n=1 Tax=Sphingobium sp. CECT 9361 TaxID=2845384 RepID=UPI001E2F5462|nr:hypothetical protein [Sphingobium sp. CECT 9361]CAH0355349.1 hypothetical protein SPH9361_03426 [Sphingobium sp. CECT 9361]